MGKRKKGLLWGQGINDVQTPTQLEAPIVKGQKRKVVWRCPYYQKWMSMIRRCYSRVSHEKRTTYKGCYVSEEWKYFSNFKAWMMLQDWEGKDLDKDLLVLDNKCYSKETCLFISPEVNVFMTSTRKNRGEYPLGVHSKGNKYLTQCHCPLLKKQEQLGLHSTPEEAHEVWKTAKLKGANYLASLPENSEVGKLLIRRYTFEEGEICRY